jgi:predicted dithiol-disulfide oxidoreductase (DUF899 family)
MESYMQAHKIVSRDEWLQARKAHLKSEKELSRLRDKVSAERRELPWVKVEKDYVFDTPEGKKRLADLFGNNSQLVVYHFMWRWNLGQGCVSCSFLGDHFDGVNIHLAHHDVSFVAISRGKLEDLAAYKKRLGWKFPLISSYDSEFNFDYGVSFTEEQIKGKVNYNYAMIDGFINELPGVSVFYKDANGDVFHTFSSYSRGLDILLGAYNFLDMTPNGRNEKQIMDWIKRNDEYEGRAAVSCCAERDSPRQDVME